MIKAEFLIKHHTKRRNKPEKISNILDLQTKKALNPFYTIWILLI